MEKHNENNQVEIMKEEESILDMINDYYARCN